MENIWDKFAPHRHSQLASGKDRTFNEFLLPKLFDILKNIENLSDLVVLDIGCGTGFLTEILSHQFKKIVGMDSSQVAISIARNNYESVQNMEFLSVSVGKIDKEFHGKFDLAIAHMSLQTIDPLDIAISKVSDLLTHDGWFLFSIPHPCFWITIKSKTKNDNSQQVTSIKYDIGAEPFQYHKNSHLTNMFYFQDEISYEIPYFHRPISFYSSILRSNGFYIIDIFEPIPSVSFREKYGRPSHLPEFLFILSRRK